MGYRCGVDACQLCCRNRLAPQKQRVRRNKPPHRDTRGQNPTSPPAPANQPSAPPSTCTWGTKARIRSRISRSKPFMTDCTVSSSAIASAIPTIETGTETQTALARIEVCLSADANAKTRHQLASSRPSVSVICRSILAAIPGSWSRQQRPYHDRAKSPSPITPARRYLGSRLPVGSSINTQAGSLTSARAIATSPFASRQCRGAVLQTITQTQLLEQFLRPQWQPSDQPAYSAGIATPSSAEFRQ